MKNSTKNSSNLTQEQLIKAHIEKLHKRGSSDFQSLLRQVERRRKKVQLNLPQLVAIMALTKRLILEWGRGTGKTTYLGIHLGKILEQMPRATGLFIGPSYQFILTRIIPSLIQGLEMFGFYQNLHYFIGERPPRSWRKSWGKAYQPPKKFDRYITFWNGMGIHLISHDVKGDGRGLNTDFIVGDEAALLSPNKLQENTDPTLRGTNKDAFQNSHFWGSHLYVSSTPLTPEGQWFIDEEEKATNEPDKSTFISATCEHNLHNLMKGYLENARKNATDEWIFDAEYRNKRPKFVKNGFYPLLDADIHCYHNYDYNFYTEVGQQPDCRGDADLVKGVPLILGIDWGAAINCLTVNQHLRSINEYRTLKSMFVLGSDQKIQDDLLADFHNYYRHHNNRTVILCYDNSGNVATGITKRNRAQMAADYLRARGWEPRLMTIGGRNPLHDDKHNLWKYMMRGGHPRLPEYRMNKGNCKELYISMRNAKAKRNRQGLVEKDKSSERSKKIPRQHATDLSDANDAAAFTMFGQLVNGIGSTLPESTTTSR